MVGSPNFNLPSLCGSEDDALGHDTISNEVPECDQQLSGQGQDHFLARSGNLVCARPEPACQRAVFLEQQETPGELDHATTHPKVAGSG